MLQLLQRRWRRHSVFRRRAPTPSALASAPLAATSPWYCWWLWLPASGSGGCTPGPGSSSGGGRVRPAARGGSGSARSFRRLSPSRSAVASILRQLRHRLAPCGSGSSCGGGTSCSGSCNGGGGGTRCFVGGHRLPRLWPLLLRSSPPSWCCWWLRLQSACSTLAQLRAWTLAFSPLLLRHLVRKPRAAGFELRLQQRRSDGCDGNNVIVMLARGSSEHLLASSTCFRYHSIIDMERPQLLPTITAMGVSAPFASLDTL